MLGIEGDDPGIDHSWAVLGKSRICFLCVVLEMDLMVMFGSQLMQLDPWIASQWLGETPLRKPP